MRTLSHMLKKVPPLRSSLLLTLCLALAYNAGCDANGDGLFSSGPIGGGGGQGGIGGSVLPATKATSVDLLLVIDNSGSMADKQEILGLAVPELVQSLVNPVCLNSADQPAANQPTGPDDDCPSDSERVFPPVTDIHIGVITTSLGGHGSDACVETGDSNVDDEAHLISRAQDGSTVDTYDDLGFLAWDPDKKASPPGETSSVQLEERLGELVRGAGQKGCGFEATLESWYRFLVEPDPHQEIEIEDATAELLGTDTDLLRQRRDFLRPDSLLLVLTLSDENDCSIRDGGQYYFAAQLYSPNTNAPFRLPRARAACADDPNDPCCASCGQAAVAGCNDSGDDCSSSLPAIQDHVNVRCWQQKRRFGVDFLWPLDRYATGMTSPEIADRHGNVVQNPLFTDLDPSDTRDQVRDPRLVFFGTLAGVPWQDIARQSSTGTPDLVNGLNSKGRTVGGVQTTSEMASNGTWALILGDPEKYQTSTGALPDDPLMIEAIDPRTGTHPILDEGTAPPNSEYDANTINGHEYTITNRGDLQYACVFELPTPRECSGMGSCDCSVPGDNPLCQDENNTFSTTQLRAKAYPGLRQLDLAKRLSMQAAVGSVCPAQLDNPNEADFGYRPFIRTLVESIQPMLD